MSSRTFSATPSVSSSDAVAVQRQQRARPRDRLPHAGQLVELALAQPGDRGADPRGDLLGHAREPRADDLGLALGRRVVDPVIQAAALEASCSSRVRLEVSTTSGRCAAAIVPSSGIVIAKSARNSSRNASNSSSARSISSISSTAGPPSCSSASSSGRRSRNSRPEQLARRRARLGGADREQLALVVPVVDRVVEVDALVALQADQLGARRGRQRARHLGLAHTRLALQQQRLLEREGEVGGRREALVGEVPLAGQGPRDVLRCG